MKSLLVLSLTFFVSTGMACPDLSGTFQCSIDPDEENDTGIISIKTDNTLESTIYVITDHDFPNDPEPYVTTGKEYGLDDGSTYKGWCENNSFKYTLYEEDESFGEIRGDVTLKLNEESNLSTHGVLIFDGKKYESKDVCKKL